MGEGKRSLLHLSVAAPSEVAEVAAIDRDHLARDVGRRRGARKTAAPPISFGSPQRPSEVRRLSMAAIGCKARQNIAQVAVAHLVSLFIAPVRKPLPSGAYGTRPM